MDQMSAEQAREAAKGLTFEDVWAALIKTDEQLLKSDAQWQEIKERMDKSDEEFKQRMKETQEETARVVRELSKNVGGVNNTLGELTEASLGIELWQKFDELGFSFTKNGRRTTFAKDGQLIAEADYFLENGEYVMPVEVKTKLTAKDIIAHLKRIEVIREYMDARDDKRKIIGAVAGGVIDDTAIKQAQEEGLYVLAPNGESIAVVPMPDSFKAREW